MDKAKQGSIGPGEEERWAVKLAAFANEKGAGLVEVLVSVVIMAIVVTIFLSALFTGSLGVNVVRERVTAENLARSQLECIKNHRYITGAIPISYTTACTVTQLSTYPVDLSISYWYSPTETFTSTAPYDSGMQWITVTVSHNGEQVFTIEEYKVDR